MLTQWEGGILSNPAKNFPSVFKGIWFFETFPYALPTLITGAIGASAAIISALFIKEVSVNMPPYKNMF